MIAFRDITERKAFEDELHQHAFYDSLTGLANRRLLVERLDQALQRSALDGKTHALIFVDVDRFKSINDSLGHVTGDEFLVAIGARMKGVVRSRDLLARFGGDEFVVLLEDVAGVDVAVAAARRICAAVEQPMVLPDGYELVASVSVGIALTEPGKTADDVLRNADVAMYDAKAKGGGGIYRVFDQASMGTRSSERLQIEADLRKGLERGELEVHYQPFYSLDEQRIVGAEALVRWRHPDERPDQPHAVHPDGRGDRADPAAGPLRARHGVPAGALDPGPAGRGPAHQRQSPGAAPLAGSHASWQPYGLMLGFGLSIPVFFVTPPTDGCSGSSFRC